MKKRIIPILLVCALLFAALPVTAAAAQVGAFQDVTTDDYFATAVQWAVSWGVTNGTSDTTFSPELTCTRAQVMTFLWRAHGEPEPKTASNPFIDVPADSYYDRSTLWAYEQGIAKGTSEDPMLFSPDAPCTCAEILTFIWRAKGSPEPSFPSPLTEGWSDVFYKDAVTWADNTAMLEDEGDFFDPDRLCTRGRTMAFLWRDAREYASDAESFLRAIGPGRELTLDPGVYNLTEWIDSFGAASALVEGKEDLELAEMLGSGVEVTPYVRLERVHDGYEIVIHDVRNLTITKGDFYPDPVELVVEPRYANVLTFENCDKIILNGLTLGHTPEQGYCTGGVLNFRDCGRIALSGMDLYGCGTYGIIAERVDSIQTVDSVIRECSYGLLDFRQVKDAGFGAVTFRDSKGFDMLNLRESAATFQSCAFCGNSWDDGWCHFLALDELSAATFLGCEFDRPAHFDLTGVMGGKNVKLDTPTVTD